jgi:hypothetical protein
MDKVYRVFFHELGHFVANELNHKYFNGTGSYEIKIYPCEKNCLDYCGHITPIRPEGIHENDKTPVPLERLAEKLASFLYGCIFQSYYMDTDILSCTKINGHNDIQNWLGSLIANGLGSLNSEIITLSIEHLDLLKSQKLLDKFVNIIPENYLIETKVNHFNIDLEKLTTDTYQIIDEHYRYYKNFVIEHQKIIDYNFSK